MASGEWRIEFLWHKKFNSTWFCRYLVPIGVKPSNERQDSRKSQGDEDESLWKDTTNYWLNISFEMNNWIAKVISSKEVLIPV